MSLPFADKPEESRVYQDLKTKVLSNLTADEFDQLKESMFSEGVNGLEDEYRRLLLLGLASDKISLSGPINKTMKIVTSSTDGSLVTIFQPPSGEIWQVVAISQSRAGASGSTTSVIYMTDGSDLVTVEEVADNSGVIPLGTNSAQPLLISNEVYLSGAYSPGANATSITFAIAVVRVR